MNQLAPAATIYGSKTGANLPSCQSTVYELGAGPPLLKTKKNSQHVRKTNAFNRNRDSPISETVTQSFFCDSYFHKIRSASTRSVKSIQFSRLPTLFSFRKNGSMEDGKDGSKTPRRLNNTSGGTFFEVKCDVVSAETAADTCSLYDPFEGLSGDLLAGGSMEEVLKDVEFGLDVESASISSVESVESDGVSELSGSASLREETVCAGPSSGLRRPTDEKKSGKREVIRCDKKEDEGNDVEVPSGEFYDNLPCP